MLKLIHIHLKNKKLFFIYILYSLSSCTKDKGEFIQEINHDPVKIDSCDTIIYTYNQEVRSIINANCVPCHGAYSSNGFLIYYSHVNAYALNGSLVGSLKGQGHPLMPPTGKLSDCDIKGIENWVKAGAKND